MTKAIHWHFCTEMSHEEIAEELGVSERKVREYLEEPTAEEVRDQTARQEAEVRTIAAQELKRQLRVAGQASRSAEKPVKVWRDDGGDLQIRDVYDDGGDLVDKAAVPADVELGIDETARYFRRKEVREILDQLTTLTGAAEPQWHEIDHSGGVDRDLAVTIDRGRPADQEAPAGRDADDGSEEEADG